MDMDGYFRFLLALIFVIGLIALVTALARRAGLGFPAAAIKRAGSRRLGVVEVSSIDGRRRLALIRRDGVEHLLLLSPTAETVIETGIVDGAVSPDFQSAPAKAAAADPAFPAIKEDRT